MNKKTILALAAFVAAGSALATVTSENTLCRIALTVTTQQVMIGLPLVDVGGGSTVEVTNFVLTDGLEVGTTLEYKDGTAETGGWKGWRINSKGGKWEAAETGAPEVTTLDRGGAVILTRPGLTELGLDSYSPLTVYLYGQVSTTGFTDKELTSGAYYLFGNPGTDAMTSVTSLGITAEDGDQIMLPAVAADANHTQYFKSFYYYDKKWYPDMSIPAGQGFWYKKK